MVDFAWARDDLGDIDSSPVLRGDRLYVGRPSYDLESGLVHVGTAAGIFYAVQVPLP